MIEEASDAGVDPRLISLHRYFIWSNRLHLTFSQLFLRNKEILKKEPKFLMGSNVGTFMAYWYSSLYVVVEGYGDLGLSDTAIDALLTDEHRDFLRRFRNGTFHFQADYYDDRFMRFIGSGADSAQWTWQLQDAFSNFFKRELGIDSDYQIEVDPRLLSLA